MIYDDEGFSGSALRRVDRCLDSVVGATDSLSVQELESLSCEERKEYLQERDSLQQETDDKLNKYGVLGGAIMGCGVAIETINQVYDSGHDFTMGVAGILTLGVVSYGTIRTAIQSTRKSNEITEQYRNLEENS